MTDITVTIPARIVRLVAVLAPSVVVGLMMFIARAWPEAVMAGVVTVGALSGLYVWLYPTDARER